MDAAMIVKRLRALSGITRKELAELADLSPSTIGRIERGTLDPTWGTLSRILEATGYRISGDTVVSAGDSTAIAAARPVLDSFLESYSNTLSAIASDAIAPISIALNAASRDVGRSLAEGMMVALAPTIALADGAADALGEWILRWTRAGWLSEKADAEDMVTLAASAGNAAKIARRNVARRFVSPAGGWRALASQLSDAGIDYAVSGLLATREDRATATAVSPVIYVRDPSRVVEALELEETTPGRGVQLIAPQGDELTRVEVDGGIRFVSRTQGVLDAFAGSGREPDKAEDALRHLLVSA